MVQVFNMAFNNELVNLPSMKANRYKYPSALRLTGFPKTTILILQNDSDCINNNYSCYEKYDCIEIMVVENVCSEKVVVTKMIVFIAF